MYLNYYMRAKRQIIAYLIIMLGFIPLSTSSDGEDGCRHSLAAQKISQYIEQQDYQKVRSLCSQDNYAIFSKEIAEPIIGYTYLLEQDYDKAAAISDTFSKLVQKMHREDFSDSDSKSNNTNQTDLNIVLISIDTLRADHLQCLGYKRQTTPVIDKLAKEGCIFANMQAASSWTAPAHASIFTGLYPSVHGCNTSASPIAADVPTLAELLSRAGYNTAAFTANPTLQRELGLHRGFGLFDNITVDLWLSITNLLFGEKNSSHTAATSDALTRSILGWLAENHTKKFFLFALYFDPHDDYTPPVPYDTMFDPDYKGSASGIVRDLIAGKQPSLRDIEHIKALYDGEIRFTDDCIGKVMTFLDASGHKDDTLIVVLSDHGEEFWDHGRVRHGITLYQEVLRVPLIIRCPSLIPAERRIDTVISQVDVMPSILDFAEITLPEQTQGASLKPWITDQGARKAEIHTAVFSELDIRGRIHDLAVICTDKKAIYDTVEKKSWLFDLRADPYENAGIEIDSVFGDPEIDKALNQWRLSCTTIKNTFKSKPKQIHLSSEMLECLKELGYAQ